MSESRQPAIFCVAPTGLAVARSAARALDGELCCREGIAEDATPVRDLRSFLRDVYLAGRPLVGVCAAGILVRSLAPFVGMKVSDPPVVAGAEDGSSWIPLLGGHRGANDTAALLAREVGGHAAITTAGDLRFGVALDAPPPGWSVVNRSRAGPLMASLLAGGSLATERSGEDDTGWLSRLPTRPGVADVVAGLAPVPEGTLGFVPRRAALGVGCVRGCAPKKLQALAERVLSDAGVAREALCGLFSVDLKADEAAVVSLAKSLGAPLRFFSAAELEAEAHRVANPSRVVFEEVGCRSVAEAAALAGAGPQSRLLVEKTKSADATCALALAPEPVVDLPGRRRGRLMLVSAGPGNAAWRTPEASRMAAEAEELVGYGPYLELLGAAARGKASRRFALGEEADRCRYAIRRAAEGRRIALVCSGDAGVYAMASLVWELLDREASGLGAHAQSVEVVVSPGVTAASAAAARLGAPLGHDYCAISLSDLLTPRERVLARVEAAARADFAVAFYNPSSERRQTLLEEARRILLRFRAPETPVAVARALGRTGESLRHTTLEGLRTHMTDMLCVVLVGSSTTRRIATPDGLRMYTPRGYRVSSCGGDAG